MLATLYAICTLWILDVFLNRTVITILLSLYYMKRMLMIPHKYVIF